MLLMSTLRWILLIGLAVVILAVVFTPLIEGGRSGLPHLRRVLCPLLTSAWRSNAISLTGIRLLNISILVGSR